MRLAGCTPTEKAAAENARAAGHDVEMVHIQFGSVLGPDKKPLKTRSEKPKIRVNHTSHI